MEIPAAGGLFGATSSTQSAPTAGGASDFATFLTLLTTQLRNQDPLKPLESSEFVAQLASFSAVEQQVRGNELLESIQSSLAGPGIAGLSAWIGKEVRVEKDVTFSGTPVDIYVAPVAVADSAKLVVRNEQGEIVEETVIPIAAEVRKWAGTGSDGGPLPDGRYSFTIDSYQGDTLIDSRPAATYDRVSEARMEGGMAILVFADGTLMRAEDATAIRDPSSS